MKFNFVEINDVRNHFEDFFEKNVFFSVEKSLEGKGSGKFIFLLVYSFFISEWLESNMLYTIFFLDIKFQLISQKE